MQFKRKRLSSKDGLSGVPLPAHRPLGSILIARGWMTVRQVDTVLDKIVEHLRSQGKFD
jgi:hypothetical protein